MIIEMNQDADGVWAYTDPGQVDMIFQLEAISGLDLTSWDVMLNDDIQWEGHEAARQKLAASRHELTHIYKQHFHDNDKLENQCRIYWMALQATRMHITGTVLETKINDYSNSQSNRRKGKGLLTASEKKRIQDGYKNRINRGEKYGAIREFADAYRVSETTIKNVLDEAK